VNVLDIDLDLFVDPRPQPHTHARDGRLSSTAYRAWSPGKVEDYLKLHCNLRKDLPLPGDVVRYQHELFDRWKVLINCRKLHVPFHLTHLDSHADMGMGDGSSAYIMGELLHQDPVDRDKPRRGGCDGLLEGNFVSFAVACRWISSIEYVYHPQLLDRNCGCHDIPDSLFRDCDPACGVLQLKRLPPECRQGVRRLREFEPIALEPEVPIWMVERDAFRAAESFSFIFLAQSPRYTPATADHIVPTIRRFIRSIG
jgi:hypothetical protein